MRAKFRIKKIDLLSAIICLLIIINLRILDFGDWQTAFRILTAIISLLLGAYCLLKKDIYHKISKYSKLYNRWLVVVLVLIVLETFNGWMNGFYHLATYLGYDYIYLWLFLFYPIMYIGVKQNGFGRLFRFICIASVFALLLKTAVWWLYNFKGVDVMHYLLYEFTEAWLRGGSQRIPATCFSGLLYGVALSSFLKSRKIMIKITTLAIILFSFWYAWEVFASRAQIISFICATCMALVFWKQSSLRRVIYYIVIAVAAIVALETVFVQDFIKGLSAQTYSIGIRFKAIAYYMQLLKQNPLLGGLYIHSESVMHGTSGTFFISDMGYLGTLIEFGIIGFFVFLWPFVLLVKMTFIDLKKHPDRIFLIFMTTYTVVFSALSNSIYNFRQFFALPFILAYFFFESVQAKKKRRIPSNEGNGGGVDLCIED